MEAGRSRSALQCALWVATLWLLLPASAATAQAPGSPSGYPQQEAPSRQDATSSEPSGPAEESSGADDAQADPAGSAPALNVNGATGGEDREPQATSGKDYAEEDLIAQQTMANETSALVRLTRWQTWIGGAGIIGLLASLWMTRGALRLSRESNENARRIGQAQVRAYLVCDGAEFIAAPEYLSCTVKLRNAGQSPAIECRLFGRVARNYNSRTPERTKLIWLESESIDVRGPVIPAASRETAYMLWTRGKLFEGYAADIVEDQRDFIIDCRAEWTDVFGEKDSLFFTLSLDYESDGKQSDTVRAGLMDARNGSAEQQRRAQQSRRT